MKKVIIASQNPVKIKAVEIGFEKMFPSESFEFEGISVSSDVSGQPTSDEETKLGASNRADNASKTIEEADYWVGIEGGIEKLDGETCSFSWIVIKSKNNGLTGKAKTGTFFLPTKITELIDAGKELGEASDIVFGETNSRQKSGAIGILTEDLISRTKIYSDTVILALIPFKNLKLY